ncbi:MAG: hypothetical protein QXR30_04105 [Candidatus Woesearchaeota archaeon]
MENSAILKKPKFCDIEVNMSNKTSNIVYIKETSENLYINQDYIVKFYKNFDEFAKNIAKKYNLDETKINNTLEDIIFKCSEKREELQELYSREKKSVEKLKNLESKTILILPPSYFCKERFIYPLNKYLQHSKYLKKIDMLYKKMKNVITEKPYLMLFPYTEIFEYDNKIEKNEKDYIFDKHLIKKIKPSREEKILKLINQEILSTKYGYLIQILREKNLVLTYSNDDKFFEKIINEANNYSKLDLKN